MAGYGLLIPGLPSGRLDVGVHISFTLALNYGGNRVGLRGVFRITPKNPAGLVAPVMTQ